MLIQRQRKKRHQTSTDTMYTHIEMKHLQHAVKTVSSFIRRRESRILDQRTFKMNMRW